MARKLVIVGFLIALSIALYTYFTRENSRAWEQSDLDNKPRIILEDFVLYRYTGAVVNGKLTARLGHLLEPNIVELYGEVKGERTGERGVERVTAESAVAYLKSNSISELVKTNEVVRAEMKGFVNVDFDEHKLSTDYAEYWHDRQEIASNRPVKVDGPNRVIKGDQGFLYQLSDSTLEVFGKVSGQVDDPSTIMGEDGSSETNH